MALMFFKEVKSEIEYLFPSKLLNTFSKIPVNLVNFRS